MTPEQLKKLLEENLRRRNRLVVRSMLLSQSSGGAIVTASFEPSTFFSPSSPTPDQGVWYDASDLSTMYQDSAGVTPAVVGQPVGLLLDKRLGLVRGPDTWPVASPAFSGGATQVSPNVYRIFSSDGTNSFVTGLATPSTAFYEVAFTIDSITTVGTGIAVEANAVNAATFTTVGRKVAIVLSNTGTGISLKRAGGITDIQISNVSIKLLPGNHATQATTSAKPVLRQHYDATGAELVSNGGFADATGWTVPAGWAISGGAATASGTSNSLQGGGFVPVEGKAYIIEFDVTAYTSGTLAVTVGGNYVTYSSASGVGHKSVAVVCGAAPGNKVQFFGGTFAGTIDNISVKEATANGYYLEFDGVDDYLRSTFTIAQPWDRVSALQQISWTASDRVFGGGNATAGQLYQNTGPVLVVHSGSTGPSIPAPVGENQIITERHDGANSRAALNAGAYVISDAGAVLPGGVTIAATQTSLAQANIRFYGTVMRQAKVVGAELVSNGGFDNGSTGWGVSNSTLAVSGGRLVITATANATAARATQTLTGLVPGTRYQVELTSRKPSGTGGSAGSFTAADGVAAYSSAATDFTRSYLFTATATTHVLNIEIAAAGTVIGDTAEFDNISVKEVATLTDSEISTLRTYLGNKAGLTL